MLTAVWLMLQFFAVGALVWAGPQLSGDIVGATIIALVGALILVPLAPAVRASLRAALTALAGALGRPARRCPHHLVRGTGLPAAPGTSGSIRVRAPAEAHRA
ncbi:hypothetical protein [Leucobacter sp. GX24907]